MNYKNILYQISTVSYFRIIKINAWKISCNTIPYKNIYIFSILNARVISDSEIFAYLTLKQMENIETMQQPMRIDIPLL